MGAPGFLSLLFGCSLLLSDIALCKGSAENKDFVLAATSECHFVNGTQRVRFLDRYFYNQEEFLYFDSDVGYYIGKTEFGRKQADYFNSNKDFIEQKRSAVETYCKYNYGWMDGIGAVGRKIKPSIKISLMNQYESSHAKQHMLLCNVFGFYPSEIEVKWFRNGVEETEMVQSTEPYRNGDWSYQMMVMLETEIEKGDTFTCEVHHSSLKTPQPIDWHPQSSDSAKNKMATGIVGFVLGIVFFIAGLVIYMRGRKATTSFPGQNETFLPQ